MHNGKCCKKQLSKSCPGSVINSSSNLSALHLFGSIFFQQRFCCAFIVETFNIDFYLQRPIIVVIFPHKKVSKSYLSWAGGHQAKVSKPTLLESGIYCLDSINNAFYLEFRPSQLYLFGASHLSFPSLRFTILPGDK